MTGQNPTLDVWHDGMSNETYHKSAGIGSSSLKTLAQQSCLHLHAQRTDPPEISAALQATFDFGTMVHCAILEPDRFSSTYVQDRAFEKKSGTTLGAQRVEWIKTLPKGAVVMSERDMTRAAKMARSVREHPVASKLLSGGHAERSAWWCDGETDVLCKFRPDFVTLDGQFLIDVKTASDVSLNGFTKQADNLMYHLQAAHYLHGGRSTHLLPNAKFIFLAVEKTAPYASIIFEASERMLGLGDDWRRYAMLRYAECEKTGVWPGPDPVQMLDIPNWAKLPPEY